jgi:hypothetical protein
VTWVYPAAGHVVDTHLGVTIAQPALAPATPTVAGSDGRGRRGLKLPPVSRRQRTDR